MLHCMVFEELDPLLARPLTFLFFLAEREKLVDDFKKTLVFLVDRIHPDTVLVFPNQLVFHSEIILLCYSQGLILADGR